MLRCKAFGFLLRDLTLAASTLPLSKFIRNARLKTNVSACLVLVAFAHAAALS